MTPTSVRGLVPLEILKKGKKGINPPA